MTINIWTKILNVNLHVEKIEKLNTSQMNRIEMFSTKILIDVFKKKNLNFLLLLSSNIIHHFTCTYNLT